MEKNLKLVEREQYDNEGMETFLIFYIDGKKEGSAKLFSENKNSATAYTYDHNRVIILFYHQTVNKTT